MRSARSRSWPLVCAAWCVGCGGDPAPPTVSVIARAPAAITLGVDSEDDVSLRLAYTDGDSDLAGGTVDVYDCRGGAEPLRLPVPALASDEVIADDQPISGELIALIPDVGAASAESPSLLCVAPPEPSRVVFCVQLADSSGHQSAGACADPIDVLEAPVP